MRPFRAVVLVFSVVVGCAGPRAVTGLGTAEQSYSRSGDVVPLMVATVRDRSDDPEIAYTRARSDVLMFSTIDVRIPHNHRPGSVETSASRPDPRRQFSATNYLSLSNGEAMVREINRRLSERPASQREVFIFVHGYNNNFAEGLFRNAQIVHDYDVGSLPVYFSWASAGALTRYLYDRDSALIARDGLAETLQLVARSKATGIIVVGHSMGAVVVMEALRTLSIRDQRKVLQRIKGVLLAAPDLDPDLFRSQVNDISHLPRPFTIVVSRRDRALDISRRLTGGEPRVGSGADIGFLQNKDIQVLDVSQVDRGGHTLFASSDTLIKLLGSGNFLRQFLTDEYASMDDAFAVAGQGTLEQASLVLYLPARMIKRLANR
ncbi:alpha/beta fold hydrolase [Ochrobactrum teleogrylli]|uniref:Alpha/beta fold hydrolase n=2 Tax=Ochrobactrum teleogrylli TaxID=2479765 RepID=A0ABY2Y0Y8_9HYPH|nr:alpha/beta fold hydrolase [[Ochrobactrum] teleogrylli]